MKELPKTYDPSSFEDRLYKTWSERGYFKPSDDRNAPTYSIVIPPPNITGQLHMGHALDNTLQDVLVRYKRMKGFSTLWVPGTDHASIATEAKIVEAMRREYEKRRNILVEGLNQVKGFSCITPGGAGRLSIGTVRRWSAVQVGSADSRLLPPNSTRPQPPEIGAAGFFESAEFSADYGAALPPRLGEAPLRFALPQTPTEVCALL